MRQLSTIALLLLSCALGSLLWCADIHAGASADEDADCACLLGGLLSGNSAKATGTSAQSPLGQHDASRCISQSPSIIVSPFTLDACGDSFPLPEADLAVPPYLSADDILRPPRTA